MTGAELIVEERRRQIECEGWSAAHDDEHTNGELAQAAACYAVTREWNELNSNGLPSWWPWEPKWWKPKDRIRDLVRAGALIAAEIDRIQRAEEERKHQQIISGRW